MTINAQKRQTLGVRIKNVVDGMSLLASAPIDVMNSAQRLTCPAQDLEKLSHDFDSVYRDLGWR